MRCWAVCCRALLLTAWLERRPFWAVPETDWFTPFFWDFDFETAIWDTLTEVVAGLREMVIVHWERKVWWGSPLGTIHPAS